MSAAGAGAVAAVSAATEAFFFSGGFLAHAFFTGGGAVLTAAFFAHAFLTAAAAGGGAAEEEAATTCVPSRLRLDGSTMARGASWAAADRAAGFAVVVDSTGATELGGGGGFGAAMVAQASRGEGESGWGRRICGGGGCGREARRGCFPFAPTPRTGCRPACIQP